MAQSWETLRKEARRLETEIESKLVEYSKLSASLQSSSSTTRSSFESVPSATEDEAIHRRPTNDKRDAVTAEAMTTDMEALLSKLSAVIEAMSSISSTSGDGKAPGSATYAHTLQRHSEILHDYEQEFRKTRNSFTMLRERSELLSGADRLRGPLGGQSVDSNSGLDALYKERASISAATTGADNAIAAGLSLKEDLDRQRAMFASMVERMEIMSEGLPAVNRLIGQIRRKKKRDVFILGAVISTLLFVTFSWKLMH